MKIAVIGTGTVGQTFASRLVSLGHEVMMGTRNVADKLASTSKDMYGNPPFSDWHQANKMCNWEHLQRQQHSERSF